MCRHSGGRITTFQEGNMPKRTGICQRCGGRRVAHVLGHCSDMCGIDLAGRHYYGHVPRDLGIGGGDDVQFTCCLDCGQIQGAFPLPPSAMEWPDDAGNTRTG
jgi:hypothetical protein